MTFVEGFLFNRKHFHATPSSVSCTYWKNTSSTQDKINLSIFDIINNKLEYIKDIEAKKVKKPLSTLYDKRIFTDDKLSKLIIGSDGTEIFKGYNRSKGIYNENIIAYLQASAFNIDAKNICLVRTNYYKGSGFYIRKDNYLEKLPLFVAKEYENSNWYEKEFYFNTADNGNKYVKDKSFLKSCLIYTCLSNQNKCLSFNSSDGQHYQNELCFDTLIKKDIYDKNILINTLAKSDLSKIVLDNKEKELIDLWNKILEEAKATASYKKDYTYGVYQIAKDINTFTKVKGSNGKENNVYDYPILNGDLETLRTKLKDYYNSHILSKLFKYELIK